MRRAISELGKSVQLNGATRGATHQNLDKLTCRKFEMIKSINTLLQKLPLPFSDLYIDSFSNHLIIQRKLLRGGGSLYNSIKNGQVIADLLSIHVPLDMTSTVLDAGCGDGRVASAFASGGKFNGTYKGFDIDSRRIADLQRVFCRKSNFSFEHADIYHSYYNVNGSTSADDYEYPYDDNYFDLIFYNSIFSHLKLQTIEMSLLQAYRCLNRSGKIWATFYVIDNNIQPEYKTEWDFNVHYDEGLTATPNNPEGCLAYNINKLYDAFERAGLKVKRYIPGFWKMPRKSLDQHEQDIFILEK